MKKNVLEIKDPNWQHTLSLALSKTNETAGDNTIIEKIKC